MTSRVLDAKILLSLARGVPRTGSQAQRLGAFYGPQADHYDAFRARLLAGRGELVAAMAVSAMACRAGGGTVVVV